jgi:hypothetical protein
MKVHFLFLLFMRREHLKIVDKACVGCQFERFMRLPAATKIDTSKADTWAFPVGTEFYKKIYWGGRLVEIRRLKKFASGRGFRFWEGVSYSWNSTHTSFETVPDGRDNAEGTPLRIPSRKECITCHDHNADGDTDVVIGFSAFQLNHSREGITLLGLVDAGRLSHPVSLFLGCRVRSNDMVVVNALEYLNANCGFCHNSSKAPPLGRPLQLNLSCGDVNGPFLGLRPWEQPAYITTIGVPSTWGINYLRVGPQWPNGSAVLARAIRTPWDGGQMPPLGREIVDPTVAAILTAWINSLPK